MYAYFKKLVYFSTECVFAPNAYRGHARAFLKDLEKIRPSVIMDIIHSGISLHSWRDFRILSSGMRLPSKSILIIVPGESLQIKQNVKLPVRGECTRCGAVSSQEVCKACVLLEGLNRGLPKLGIGKTSLAIRAREQQDTEKKKLINCDFWLKIKICNVCLLKCMCDRVTFYDLLWNKNILSKTR